MVSIAILGGSVVSVVAVLFVAGIAARCGCIKNYGDTVHKNHNH